MIRARMKRLANMDATEIRWRVRTQGRAMMDRVTTGFIAPAWKRELLLERLTPVGELVPARAALARHDWHAAHLALSNHCAQAAQRFVVGPAARTRLAESVCRAFPGSAGRAAAAANRILDGQYDLLGYRGLRFDGPGGPGGPGSIDWHLDPVHQRRAPMIAWSAVRYLDPSCGDHKIIWELNRHQHWLTLGRAYWLTGDDRYRDRCVLELAGWLAANPPLVGINWASMLELSLRSMSWVWALSLFAGDERGSPSPSSAPWVVDLLLALDLQLAHVERHLSWYFSPNTHLLGEALALYVCGIALPELAASPRRAATGRRILLAEITRQIASDGGHRERSTHYHRYALDFYLLALAVARINGDPAATEFERAVSSLATAARLLADDRGRVPHIGDDDGGMLLPMTGRHPDDLRDSLAIAAALIDRPQLRIGRAPEAARWLLGHERLAGTAPAGAQPAPRRVLQCSGALEETGYYVSRTAAADHLVIDGGPHGYQNGGHAHADALSLTFSVGGRPLFIDPGTGCYTADAELRERFRSTALHNTVTVDGRPSSVTNGPFHWSQVANGRVRRWRTTTAFDYFDGVHDGYHPITHRRSVLSIHGDLLIVADFVEGAGVHAAATHWHVDPAWSVAVRGRHVTFSRRGRQVSLLVPHGNIETFTADRRAGLGWHSPAYGCVEPATTLRITRDGALPLAIVSVIGLDPGNAVQDVTVMPADRDGTHAPMCALRIARAASADYVLIANSDTPDTVDTRRPAARIGELDTDAHMLFYRSSAGRLTRLAFVDGSFVRTAVGPDLRLEFPREIPHYLGGSDTTSPASLDRAHPQRPQPTPCAASPAS